METSIFKINFSYAFSAPERGSTTTAATLDDSLCVLDANPLAANKDERDDNEGNVKAGVFADDVAGAVTTPAFTRF